jgi:hypothetical protein
MKILRVRKINEENSEFFIIREFMIGAYPKLLG